MADEAALTTPELAAADEAPSAGTLLTGDAVATESTEAVATAEGSAAGVTGDGVAGVTGDETAVVAEEAGVPETYEDFTLPEGIELDAALMETAVPLFKELGLTQTQAQKLVDFQAAQTAQAQQAQVESFTKLVGGWETAARNDKEYGGGKFDENVAHARSAVAKFGTPAFKQLLEDHGTGSHPEMIRFLISVGKLTAEDNPGSAGNPGGAKAKDHSDILYPKG